MSRVSYIIHFAKAFSARTFHNVLSRNAYSGITFKDSKALLNNLSNQRGYNSMVMKDPKTFSTSSVLQQPRSLTKLKKLQQDFQCEDGRPIWLKYGFCDRILYTTTVVACYVGLLMILFTIYDHAKPASWKTKQTC